MNCTILKQIGCAVVALINDWIHNLFHDTFICYLIIIIIIIIIINLTANGLSPGGSGYNACT